MLDIAKAFSTPQIGHAQIKILNVRILSELFSTVVQNDSPIFQHLGMGGNIESQFGILFHQKH